MPRTVEFRCPQCAKFYRVARDDRGRNASCTSCGSSFAVPERSERITRVERWASRRNQHLVAAESLGGGSDDSLSRGIRFLKTSVAMAWSYKASLLPTAIAVMFCLAFALAFYFTGGPRSDDWEPTFAELFVVLFPQYVVFYFSMGMTIRMVFGYLIGERVSFGQAFSSAMIRLPNIILMALIGTLFDLAAEAARRQDGMLAQIAASIIEAIWTTASFLLMPAIMIDNATFTGGLKKTKDVIKRNLVPIGVGEIGVRMVTFGVNIAATLIIVGMLYLLSSMFPGVSLFVPMVVALVLWVVSISVFNVYVRTVYYTSLYIWTVSTEEAQEMGGKVWVPAPIAEAMA